MTAVITGRPVVTPSHSWRFRPCLERHNSSLLDQVEFFCSKWLFRNFCAADIARQQRRPEQITVSPVNICNTSVPMCPATSVPSVPQCPVPICLTDSSALVPKYLGSKMSWVRSVCTPLTRLRNDYQAHCLCVGTAISLSFHPAKLAYSQRRRHACYVTGRPYACSATCRAAPTGECDDDNR